MPDPSKAFAGKESCLEQKNSDAQGSSLEYPVGCPGNAYWWSGFSTIQFAVENTWLKVFEKDFLFIQYFRLAVKIHWTYGSNFKLKTTSKARIHRNRRNRPPCYAAHLHDPLHVTVHHAHADGCGR